MNVNNVTDRQRAEVNAMFQRVFLRKTLSGLDGFDPEEQYEPEYKQFKNKPKEAILHLMKVKKGRCSDALYREDIGFVDIIWGYNNPKTNIGFGLKHIIEKHGKEIAEIGFKVEDFIPFVFSVLPKAKKQVNPKSKLAYENKLYKIIISNGYKGNNKKWVLTSYDRIKRKKGS
ncbi:MAG: hypothetical protein M9892_07655 [Bacteroidetes bacterium]|nr:hypothetical protein [Bacteroidota bacterium]